ncbi:hypothetical protein M3Y94_01270600 [Aphelenchoides besseyi]|nr:hypothetical protein M3Y94_01270600 [Aphelenchoides besseyi]KAI6222630.1 hypothetical protein M3Y95_00914000 [Aphelenchoides besseyi]
MWSQSAKNTNVLVLLNTLYTSGFASMSPTVPRLTSRTMHSLYAISFVVYSIGIFTDWLHTYAVLRGSVTSFPLEDWFVIALVGIAVCGSMLTMLLLVLCIENAFAYRVHITPYRTGLAVIWEAFLEWLHSFNNFRVAFLFAVFHDAPMTLTNFFLISSCRCAGGEIWQWTLIFSTTALLISLSWRLVLLYFAYRRLVCPRRFESSNAPSRTQSFREHFEQQISLSDGGRLWDFDETWPIRWSIAKVYGEYPIKQHKIVYYKSNGTLGRFLACLETAFCFAFVWVFQFLRSTVKRVACFLLSALMYTFCISIACLPCIHFYTCRKHSFARRHKCSKAFVRYFTLLFHYFMMIFSIVSTVLLLGLNIVMLSSVHGVGSNNLPPEIYKVCHLINRNERTIQTYFLPYIGHRPQLKHGSDGELDDWICKPIWEDPNTRLRLHSGPWQARIALKANETLAISTQFTSNFTVPSQPTHTILFDFAVLFHNHKHKGCHRGFKTNWRFVPHLNDLPPPYFVACKSTIRLFEKNMITC